MADINRLGVLSMLLLLPVLIDALTATEKARFQATVTVTTSANQHTFSSNGIPDHDNGPFPSPDNPNRVQAQSFSFSVPETPTMASEAGCMPMGHIGMAINGVAFYNPYTAEQLDAVENEVMDGCGGHPSPNGAYHYHQSPHCLYQGGNNEFLGVALDGFPIYGKKDENGAELSYADLDQCHGRMYNGQYQYHMSTDFPYIIGCFKGAVTLNSRQQQDCSMAVADEYDGDNDTDGGDDGGDDGGNNAANVLSSSLFVMILVALVH